MGVNSGSLAAEGATEGKLLLRFDTEHSFPNIASDVPEFDLARKQCTKVYDAFQDFVSGTRAF